MPKTPDSFESAVGASIGEWIHRYIPAVADSLGPLPDTVEPTRREKADRWNLRSDKVPPGAEDQLADEALQMIVEEHQQQGKPPPDPDTLAKLTAARVNSVLYPYRREVYGRGLPRPEERVAEARRYAKLSGEQVLREPTTASAPTAAPESPAMPDATETAATSSSADPTERGY